jgi:spore germination protein GerM
MKKMMISILFVLIVLGIGTWAYISSAPHAASPTPLPSTTTTSFNIYFPNEKFDPLVTCEKVFPVKRTVAKTVAVGVAALNELLKGPTAIEKSSGYSTTLPSGAHLKLLTINNGTANADFDQALQQSIGGSCRVGLIRRQITETLLQFPSVKAVVISIDGRTEDILQP